MNPIKTAIIGLDTGHSTSYTQLLQGSTSKPANGLVITRCLRFPTPFYSEEGQDARQHQLESWDVQVTRDFDEAVADCEAVLLCINDPSYHLEYFKRCAGLGKPLFLDKPMADTLANGKAILQCAKENNTRFFSSSSLRFSHELIAACENMPHPLQASMYGPLGQAPAGSSIIWYGVHAFEMLQCAIGRGAESVRTLPVENGIVSLVKYECGRHGVVELMRDSHVYAGCLRDKDIARTFMVDVHHLYEEELAEITHFFQGGPCPVEAEDTLEVLALLDAAQESLDTGKEVPVCATP